MATNFRTSKCRINALFKCKPEEGGDKILSFTAHHEMRFVEHLHALVNATLRNIVAYRTVWTSAQEDENATCQKKGTAKGFLKVWSNDSIQMKMTALMYDVLEIFKRLQQGLQWPALILPEVLSLRDSAVRKLKVIIATPMPSGMEEKLVVNDEEVKESSEAGCQASSTNTSQLIRDLMKCYVRKLCRVQQTSFQND